MNKQELINELKRISLEKQYESLTHPESKNYYEGMVMAYSQVVHMVNTVLKLDEPQKPVVPKFVADWFEKFTDPFTKAEKIAYLIKSKDGNSYYFCDWFVQDGILTQEQGEELLAWAERQSYETLLSLYNGYEVEKEPLYYLKLPVVYFNHLDLETYLMKDDRGNITIADNNDFDDMKFTESEIKAIDERYWPFAEPVEEV